MVSASFAACAMARALSRVSLSGFSHSTCLPAARAASRIGRCRLLATTMLMTSTSSACTTASQFVSWRS